MTLERNKHMHKDKNSWSVLNLQYMIDVAKALSYNQNYILWGLSSPVSVLYTCIKLLNNFSSETTWAISHEISCLSYCLNRIESLFNWSHSIDFHAQI